MRHQLALAVVLASTVCTAGVAYPADETQSATFTLHNVKGPVAATVLRTIAYVKDLELPDEHTVTIHDTRETVELATAMVKMLDTTDPTADTTPLPAGDGTIIVAVALTHTSSTEVMTALREELRLARQATAGEKRIFLRDTDRQIMDARKVIERLERSHDAGAQH